MRTIHLRFVALAGVLSAALIAQGQTAFTYQGKLDDTNHAANGNYDFIFRLFDAGLGGSQIGSSVPVNDWPVSDGLFTVQLDFGSSPFNGAARWLQAEVRPGASVGPYTVLTPRQPLTAVPYAMFAFAGAPASTLWAANGANIYKTNTGNVGIGTNAPETLLELRGAGAIERINGSGSSFGPQLEFKSNVTTFGTFGTVQFLDGADTALAELNYVKPLIGVRRFNMVTAGGGIGILDDGKVAISSVSAAITPAFQLDVGDRVQIREGASGSAGIWLYQDTPAEVRGFLGMQNDNYLGLYGTEGAGWGLVMNNANGRVGIGDSTPGAQLDVKKSAADGVACISSTNSGTGYAGYFSITNASSTATALYCRTSGTGPAITASGDAIITGDASIYGTATVGVLQITGADVAEKFPTSETAEFAPGTVMAIDPLHPGTLCVASGEYNRFVAGVVSGANGLPAAAILGHMAGQESAPAIALSGRVWVRCVAGDRAIEPGDFLTTSNTPGCAMAVCDPARAVGAVIGKAMTGLARGESGLVLVLVNLQ